jgi:hypothetical protein
MPEIKSDLVEVPLSRQQVEPEGGARPEPEQMPATHKMEIGTDLLWHGAGNTGKQIRSFVSHDTTAETAAAHAGAQCHRCRFWNQAAWAQQKQRLDYSPSIADRKNLQSVRGMFLDGQTTNSDVRQMHRDEEDQFDTESAISSMGVCEAFTSIFAGGSKGTIISHALASCPRDAPIYGGPAPFLFLPRDADQKRMGESLHSRVLRLADGRAPKLYSHSKP